MHKQQNNQIGGGRNGSVESLKQICHRQKKMRGYETHEILHALGLLISPTLSPQNRRFANPWTVMEAGAVSDGNFGRLMARNLYKTSCAVFTLWTTLPRGREISSGCCDRSLTSCRIGIWRGGRSKGCFPLTRVFCRRRLGATRSACSCLISPSVTARTCL